MNARTFAPGTATVNLAVSTVSANVALNPNASAVRVANTGATMAFIQFGDSSVTASLTASMPLPAGAVETFTKGSAAYVAAISTGTTTLYFTAGEGM